MKPNSAGNGRLVHALGIFSLLALLGAGLAWSHAAAAAGLQAPRTAAVQNTGGGSVHVRAGANLGYDVRGSLAEGDQVAVLEGPVRDSAGHSWYRVSYGAHIGWIDGRYLSGSSAGSAAAKPAPKAAAPARLKGYVQVANSGGDAVRLRAQAGTGGQVVATAGTGTVMQVIGQPTTDKAGGVWYHVAGANVSGWMLVSYLTPAAVTKTKTVQTTVPKTATIKVATVKAPAKTAAAKTTTARTGGATAAPASKASGVVGVALSYVGYRYRFGGTSPAGFDCSGFVYYVFNKAGIPMGRSMNSEVTSGVQIKSSQLQPGDLVYFAGTYRGGISHIAIYIGNGRIVHAADYSTGVEISDLWSPYWAAHYAGAVRVTR